MNEQIKIGSIIKQIRGVSYKPTDVREADEENAVALVVVDNTILSIQMDENQFIVCNDKGYDIAYYESLA